MPCLGSTRVPTQRARPGRTTPVQVLSRFIRTPQGTTTTHQGKPRSITTRAVAATRRRYTPRCFPTRRAAITWLSATRRDTTRPRHPHSVSVHRATRRATLVPMRQSPAWCRALACPTTDVGGRRKGGRHRPFVCRRRLGNPGGSFGESREAAGQQPPLVPPKWASHS